MKALILNGCVVDISESEFPVAPPLLWKDCPDDCSVGWLYADENFSQEAEHVLNKNEVLIKELPDNMQKLNALWMFIANNDRTLIDSLLAQEEIAYQRYNEAI